MVESRAAVNAGSHAMTDFVVGVVRVAFLVRLGALLFVLLMPLSELIQGQVIAAVLVIATTSVLGFYRVRAVVRFAHRHPMIVAADVLLAAGVTALVGADSPLIFYTLSTAVLLGVLLPPLSAGLLTLILVMSQILAMVEGRATANGTLYSLLILPATCVIIVLLGGVARVLHEQVLVEHEQVSRLQTDAAKHAERARIAREMHDSVAKSLHGIGLAAAALPTWLERDPQAGIVRAAEIRRAAEIATREARELLTGLRGDLSAEPLATLLEKRVARFAERSGVLSRLELGGVVDLAPAARVELLRIVDEALENVARHADADEVTVVCRPQGPDLVVEIIDDGRGFDIEEGLRAPGHYGLQGMEERARAVGGWVDLTSVPGSGTTVRIELRECGLTRDAVREDVS